MEFTLHNKKALKDISHSCSECSLVPLCLPVGMSQEDMARLEAIVETRKPYQNGEAIFTAGSPFRAVYAVKSGLFKTVSVDEGGAENVVGFHLPGELVGLDAIYLEKYSSSAVSIGTSSVCVMRYEELTELAASLPSLQHQLLRLLSKELNTTQSLALEQPAEQKLATFLLGLSSRYKQRGYSEKQLTLVMPRRDIANHLGMAAETISRLLKRFQDKGVVQIQRRELVIENMEELKQLAGSAAVI